jgi:hypothetical protein
MDGRESKGEARPATAGRAAAWPFRRRTAAAGSYLYGVVRPQGERAPRLAGAFERVRYRDVEALARPTPFDLPPLDPSELLEHQKVVDAVLWQTTILPAPPGVVFRNRRLLFRFLEEQYLTLDAGLSFLDGHWEVRLHIEVARGVEARGGLLEQANLLYGELRRLARAAVPFPREGRDRLLGAAFLVDRTRWIAFIERAEELGALRPALVLDLTGPWPPYDFVKLVA